MPASAKNSFHPRSIPAFTPRSRGPWIASRPEFRLASHHTRAITDVCPGLHTGWRRFLVCCRQLFPNPARSELHVAQRQFWREPMKHLLVCVYRYLSFHALDGDQPISG